MATRPSRDFADEAAQGWARIVPDADLTAYQVALRLIRGGRIAETALSPSLAADGLDVPGDYEVLATLRRAHPEPLRPVVIAERVMISPPGMTGRLDRLEHAGLIERRPDPTDRRATLVSVTERGIAVADTAFGAVVAAMARLVEQVDPADLAHFADCLRAVLRALGDLPEPH